MSKRKKIVCLGGGTGTFVVLTGLRGYQVDLSAIVSMFDSGGSNRVVREEFNLLPTSDLRQCLVALTDDKNKTNQALKDLFLYRFSKGKGLKGMTFGNLFLVALSNILGSQIKAIRETEKILDVGGRVIPVTLTDSNLVAVYENGKKVIGEHFIDEPRHNGKLKISKAYLEPKARAYPEALKAIEEADLVVIGPGDIYTSLVPNLLVEGISKALRKTRAKIVFVLNLMTRYGQTFDLTAKDHIQILEKYLGDNCLNFVLVNSKPVPKFILEKYKKEKEAQVKDDLSDSYYKVIRRDFLCRMERKKVPGDILKRSLICHDPKGLAKKLVNLCKR